MLTLPRITALIALLLAACGEPACPQGSLAIGDRCEPIAGSGGTSSGDGGSSATGGGDAGGEGGSGGDAGGTGGSGGVGGSSGTGGDGGDSAVTDCDDDTDCLASLPQCNSAGQCVSCSSNAACEDRGPLAHCESTSTSDRRRQCVECLEDDHCEGNEAGEYNTCVPCKADADCGDLTKPQCSPEGQCVGCTDSEAFDGPPTPKSASPPPREIRTLCATQATPSPKIHDHSAAPDCLDTVETICATTRRAPAQNFDADPLPDAPVERRQPTLERLRDST